MREFFQENSSLWGESVNRLSSLAGQQQESEAAQIILSIVPLVAVVFGCTLFFFFLFWNYRLRKLMIQNGQPYRLPFDDLRLWVLLLGLLALMAGIPIASLFYFIEGFSYILLGGLIPLFTGVGLILFYVYSRRKEQ